MSQSENARTHSPANLRAYGPPPTASPEPASSSASIPILCALGSESGSASIASASASSNRPSSMNGVPNAFTICAWPVVLAPGATCPPLPGIVDGRCAAVQRGWFEDERDFLMVPFYEYLACHSRVLGVSP
jgi:hypothetical protein